MFIYSELVLYCWVQREMSVRQWQVYIGIDVPKLVVNSIKVYVSSENPLIRGNLFILALNRKVPSY